MRGEEVIYLDAHASTAPDPLVINTMMPFFTSHYANGNHTMGWRSSSAIERARFHTSNLLGCYPSEIFFTSGATESINIALWGLTRSAARKKNQIISQPTEHPAVLNCLNELANQGFDIQFLKIDQSGVVDLDDLKSRLSDQTLLVAIMMVNNEVGTIQPIEEIGTLCEKAETTFFCDLTQGIGWQSVNIKELKVDLACLSGHKFYGPRGVGAIYKSKLLKAPFKPLLFGGGQERGIRPGTHNTPGIVGFGKACELAQENYLSLCSRMTLLRDRLLAKIRKGAGEVFIHGSLVNRHPGNLNISIPGIKGDELQSALSNIIFSTSSACSSSSTQPSHVLQSLGLNKEKLDGAMRFGICKYNTTEEIDLAARLLCRKVQQIRS